MTNLKKLALLLPLTLRTPVKGEDKDVQNEDALYMVRPEQNKRSKKVPENIHELFTSPYALAMWFLGDGWKASDCRNIHFAGGEWTEEEVKRMQKCLLDNFDLHTTIVRGTKDERTHRFTIPEKDYDKFCNYVNPYIRELVEFVGPSIYNDKYFKSKLLRDSYDV